MNRWRREFSHSNTFLGPKPVTALVIKLEHYPEQGNLLPSSSNYSKHVKHYRAKPIRLRCHFVNHQNAAFRSSYLASKINEKKMNKQNAQGGHYKYEKPGDTSMGREGVEQIGSACFGAEKITRNKVERKAITRNMKCAPALFLSLQKGNVCKIKDRTHCWVCFQKKTSC